MTTNKAKLSIGLPIYNGERYLEETLNSILSQTYSNYELIISDNASNDKTQDICQSYALKDCRIRYYRNRENIGAVRNFYKVFNLASSEYFKWIADDDVYAPEFLQKCIDVLDHNPSVILCFTKTIIIDEQSRLVKNLNTLVDTTSTKPFERFYSLIRYERLGVQMYGVIRSSALKMMKVYSNNKFWDYNFLAELCLLGSVYEVPDRLFLHRLHEQSWGYIISHPGRSKEKFDYDPNFNWSRDFSLLYRCINYFIAVHNAPIRLFEKMMCYLQVQRFLVEMSIKKIRYRLGLKKDSRHVEKF